MTRIEISRYISSRFPAIMIAVGIARFSLVYFVAAVIQFGGLVFSSTILVGGLSCVIFMLTQRISDDLMDEHSDRLATLRGDRELSASPLLDEVISRTGLVSLRRLLFAFLVLLHAPMVYQSLGALLLVICICYWIFNVLSFRLSGVIPGLTSVAVIFYAACLCLYDHLHLHQMSLGAYLGSTFQLNGYVFVLIVMVSWLPIVMWHSMLKAKAPSAQADEAGKVLGTRLIVVAASTSVSLLAYELSLLNWIALPLIILTALSLYFSMAVLRGSKEGHVWFRRSVFILGLFQLASIPTSLMLYEIFN